MLHTVHYTLTGHLSKSWVSGTKSGDTSTLEDVSTRLFCKGMEVVMLGSPSVMVSSENY